MTVRSPSNQWITVHADSRRWAQVVLDPGDIVISTPPKSGTTLTQGIVHSLLWPAGDAPDVPLSMSPWVDFRMRPMADTVERLAAQPHRRFVKTHTPADCMPIDDDLRYLAVYRDGRDAIVSWSNHRARYQAEAMRSLNAAAAEDGLAPLDPDYDGSDLDAIFEEWLVECSSVRHLASWWPLRDRSNVMLVHYADLIADLEVEMRAIARFLEIDVAEEHWPAVVDRCRIDEMRAAADAAAAGVVTRFDGGAAAFFHKGTNGRWVDVLSDTHLDRYAAHVAHGLSPDAAAWLERGGDTD